MNMKASMNKLMEYYTTNLILACFVCYLKFFYQNFFWKYLCIKKQIVQGTKTWHDILVGKRFLSYGTKWSEYCFDK